VNNPPLYVFGRAAAPDAQIHLAPYGALVGVLEEVGSAPGVVLAALRRLTSEQRLEAFAPFCTFCGDETSHCPCMKDDQDE
jgi:hypothetical protein